MKEKRFNAGTVWGLSKIASLVGALMLFSVLMSFHFSLSATGTQSMASGEAANIASIMNSFSSAPYECEIIYDLPESLSQKPYSIRFSGNMVTVSINGTFNATAFFFSPVSRSFSCSRCIRLRIRKYGDTIEVNQDDV